MTNNALTTEQLADALGCFWNAAIGEAHNKQNDTTFSTIACIAVGLGAVATRLQELSTTTTHAAESARSCTCHPSEAPQPCAEKYAFSECVAAAPTPPVASASDEPVAWQQQIHGKWCNLPTDWTAAEAESASVSGAILRPLYTRPQSVKEAVEAARENIKKIMRGLAIPEHKRNDAEFLRTACMVGQSFAEAALASLSQEQG